MLFQQFSTQPKVEYEKCCKLYLFLDASASLGQGLSVMGHCWKMQYFKKTSMTQKLCENIALTHLCPIFGLVWLSSTLPIKYIIPDTTPIIQKILCIYTKADRSILSNFFFVIEESRKTGLVQPPLMFFRYSYLLLVRSQTAFS